MQGYVAPPPPDESDEGGMPELPPGVQLPYPLPTCLGLWLAWEKGIMPRSGGYLDQPRAWQRMISLFNKIHNPIAEAHRTEPRRQREDTGGRLGEDFEGIIGGAQAGAPLSWDELTRG